MKYSTSPSFHFQAYIESDLIPDFNLFCHRDVKTLVHEILTEEFVEYTGLSCQLELIPKLGIRVNLSVVIHEESGYVVHFASRLEQAIRDTQEMFLARLGQ